MHIYGQRNQGPEATSRAPDKPNVVGQQSVSMSIINGPSLPKTPLAPALSRGIITPEQVHRPRLRDKISPAMANLMGHAAKLCAPSIATSQPATPAATPKAASRSQDPARRKPLDINVHVADEAGILERFRQVGDDPKIIRNPRTKETEVQFSFSSREEQVDAITKLRKAGLHLETRETVISNTITLSHLHTCALLGYSNDKKINAALLAIEAKQKQ